MKDLAWEKIHQEAQGHFIDKNLKLNDVNHNMLIQNVIIQNNADKEYDISRDKEYIKINHNESSAMLYDYIKEKATSTFRQFSHTRHAVVENTKISKNGKTAKVLDLLACRVSNASRDWCAHCRARAVLHLLSIAL